MDTFCPDSLWGLQEVCWGELLIDTWIVGYFLIFVPNIFCSNIPLNIIISLISTISLSPIPHSESQSIFNLIGINSREWDRVIKSAQYCCSRKYSGYEHNGQLFGVDILTIGGRWNYHHCDQCYLCQQSPSYWSLQAAVMAGYGYNNIDAVNFLLIPDTRRSMIEPSNKWKLNKLMYDILFVYVTERERYCECESVSWDERSMSQNK